MQRAARLHGSVEVVEMTSGEAFPKGVSAVRPVAQLTADSYRWYGAVREREAVRAMDALAIRKAEGANLSLVALARRDGHAVFTGGHRVLEARQQGAAA